MQFRFCFSEGYSKKDLLLFNRVYIRRGKVTRWAVPLLRVFLVLLGFFLLLTGILLVGEPGSGTLAVTFIIVGLLWILLGIFRDRLNAWRSRKMMLRRIRWIECILDDAQITEKTDFSSSGFEYQPDYALVHYKDSYFLFLDKRHALLLPVSNMTEGTPEELERFWEAKMGKPVENYK